MVSSISSPQLEVIPEVCRPNLLEIEVSYTIGDIANRNQSGNPNLKP